MKEKKELIQWFGLLGVISFLSYIAAMVFSPLAYPGYNWMEQAVSDLSAVGAPSKMLWTQLASLYEICGVVSITIVCIYVKDNLQNKCLRVGIYLFAIMSWISGVGYRMFPLANPDNLGGFQDVMHLVVTALVVLLSIVSLIVIMVGGYKGHRYVSIANWALVAFLMMFIGAIGTNVVPKEYFGIVERFSVLAATGYNAVLGVYLFTGFRGEK